MNSKCNSWIIKMLHKMADGNDTARRRRHGCSSCGCSVMNTSRRNCTGNSISTSSRRTGKIDNDRRRRRQHNNNNNIAIIIMSIGLLLCLSYVFILQDATVVTVEAFTQHSGRCHGSCTESIIGGRLKSGTRSSSSRSLAFKRRVTINASPYESVSVINRRRHYHSHGTTTARYSTDDDEDIPIHTITESTPLSVRNDGPLLFKEQYQSDIDLDYDPLSSPLPSSTLSRSDFILKTSSISAAVSVAVIFATAEIIGRPMSVSASSPVLKTSTNADDHSSSSSLSSSSSVPLLEQASSVTTAARPSTSAATTATTTSLQESLSGLVAGASLAASKTLVKYPLDTATVRVQMPASNYTLLRPIELFDGCWDGITFTLLSNVPAGAVFFGVKDAVKTGLVGFATNNVHILLPKWFTTTLAVAVAQIPYWIVRNPSEVIKVRQQTSLASTASTTKQQRSAWTVIQGMTNDSDQPLWTQLYIGYWENVAYAFPADVLKFVIYESLKSVVVASSVTSSTSFSPLEGAVIGATATALSQLLTTPLDVVRNRRMMIPSPQRTDSGPTTSNYLQTLIDLGKVEGWKGMFAGAAPRVGKALLSGAIQFATYEETKTVMIRYLQDHLVPSSTATVAAATATATMIMTIAS